MKTYLHLPRCCVGSVVKVTLGSQWSEDKPTSQDWVITWPTYPSQRTVYSFKIRKQGQLWWSYVALLQMSFSLGYLRKPRSRTFEQWVKQRNWAQENPQRALSIRNWTVIAINRAGIQCQCVLRNFVDCGAVARIEIWADSHQGRI